MAKSRVKLWGHSLRNAWKRSRTYKSKAVQTCQRTALAVFAEKVAELEGLFNLLKKRPRFASGSGRDRRRSKGPTQSCGQKLHDRQLAIEFDLRGDPAQAIWGTPRGSWGQEDDLVVARMGRQVGGSGV